MNRRARRWAHSLMMSCLALAVLNGCTRRDAAESTDLESTNIGYSASGIELIQTDTEGRIRYQLTATELAQDPRSREMRLASVELRMKTNDNIWQATARSATLSADASQLAFRERVLLETAGQPALRLRTDALDYNLATRRARSPGATRIHFDAGELTANRVDVELERQRLSLGNSVHGRFAP